MIIDLGVFLLVAWTGFLGYIAGARRCLIYVAVIGGAAYILTTVIPWLHFVGSDHVVQFEYLQWLNRMLEPIIPVLRSHVSRIGAADVFAPYQILPSLRGWYQGLLSVGTTIAGFLGLILGVRSFDTIWTDVLGKNRMTPLGAVYGIVTGLYVAMILFNSLSVLVWAQNPDWLRLWIYHSLFVRAWTHIRLHGIVS